jgi:anti-sigma factor RsiW
MTPVLEEQLSAYLDGELPAAEVDLLLARLERDAACRRKLARFGLIGEALRGPVYPGSLNIAEKVRQNLVDVEAVPVSGDRRRRVWLGWTAAGVAATAVVAGVVRITPDATRSEVVAATAPVAVFRRDAPVRARPLGASRMTNYLVYHSNYTTAPFRGTLNAHLVSAVAPGAGWQQSAEDGGNGR